MEGIKLVTVKTHDLSKMFHLRIQRDQFISDIKCTISSMTGIKINDMILVVFIDEKDIVLNDYNYFDALSDSSVVVIHTPESFSFENKIRIPLWKKQKEETIIKWDCEDDDEPDIKWDNEDQEPQSNNNNNNNQNKDLIYITLMTPGKEYTQKIETLKTNPHLFFEIQTKAQELSGIALEELYLMEDLPFPIEITQYTIMDAIGYNNSINIIINSRKGINVHAVLN